MKKILVTGASGLLGLRLVKTVSREYGVIPTHRTESMHPHSIMLDITNRDIVSEILNQQRPDIVIHAAAETGVDRCETEKELAWNVNTVGTRNVAEACAKIDAKLVYISTDYVFDGEKGLYSEEDETGPVNYYGLTKLRGEDYVRELCTDYVIARTSVIYGWHPRRLNFVTWVIDSVVNQKTISVVLDHYNSPTLADSLAEMVLHALDKGVGGVYHLTGGERISRYEFAIRVARTFHLDETLIMPVKMSDLNTWIAKRPRDSSLRIDKAEKEIDVSPMSLNVALERMKSSKDNAHTTLWIRGILEKDYEMGASTKILRKTAPRSSKSPSGLRAGA